MRSPPFISTNGAQNSTTARETTLKKISAKIDEYTKDGQTKGRYADVGVIMENDRGSYVILNPTVDLAGIWMRQKMLSPDKGGKGVMCSIFEDDAPPARQPQQPSRPAPQQASLDSDEDIPF